MRVCAARGGRAQGREIGVTAGLRGLALVGGIIIAAAGGSLRLGAQAANAVAPALYSGLTWRCTGPFDGGPVASVAGTPGEPGIYLITTPSGGAWKTTDGGGTWTSIDHAGVAPAAGDPHRWVDPANPRRIVRTEAQGIGVSLDAGATWTSSHNLPIADVVRLTPHEHPAESARPPRTIAGAPVNVSIADPARPGLLFAGTNQSVYVSFDRGARWAPLELNMPSVAINDLDIRGNNLVAATDGRSVWELDDISPLRQLSAGPGQAPSTVPESQGRSGQAFLFAPADAVVSTHVDLDYYVGTRSNAVTLEVIDAGGRVVHAATSAVSDSADHWLPVMRPLSAAPGQHRVVWNLRFDPPPSPQNRFAELARTLFENTPADPDGPLVLAGAYRVRLTVDGHEYTQPLVVRDEPGASAAAIESRRDQFELEMKAYDAMQVAHRGFLQLTALRARVTALLTSTDPDLAAAATDLDTRLAAIDGSDWTGLIIPDADNEAEEVDAKEGKHPDFVPPVAVSLSKDYDDPTSILGRAFANVAPAPAFAVLGLKLGRQLQKMTGPSAVSDALAVENYDQFCEQLAGVLATWQAINTQDLPALNATLAKRKLPALPIAANVPAVACAAKQAR